MTSPFIPYAKQSITEGDQQAVLQALKGEAITRGAKVQDFEQAIAQLCGAKYAVVFNSGTTALQAAYYAAQVTPSDRVVSTPNTFVATISGAIQRGASIIFAEIDRSIGAIDLDKLSAHLNFKSTRGRLILAPVHFAGIALDMQKLDSMIHSPDCIIIEDAAHAIGSSYPTGQKVGSCLWSQMTVFSFHPAKTITTGEGGMVTTNDPQLHHRLLLFRNNGIEREAPYLEGVSAPWYYEVQDLTGNYHFTDFQAALGLSQLRRLTHLSSKRRELVKLYREKLKGTPHIRLLTDAYDAKTTFHLFVVQIDFEAYRTDRQTVMTRLKERGIGTQVHYIPLYKHPFFKHRYKEQSKDLPETELYYQQALSLPLFSNLKEEDIERICQELHAVLGVSQ